MGSCIISGKAKSIEDTLKNASFVALGSDGNYNSGGTSLSWTASRKSLVFCNWEGLSSNYTGSISFTGGGYQIGSRLYQSPLTIYQNIEQLLRIFQKELKYQWEEVHQVMNTSQWQCEEFI